VFVWELGGVEGIREDEREEEEMIVSHFAGSLFFFIRQTL